MKNSPKPIGDSLKASNAAWSFDGDVVHGFEQHALRSIPLYEEGHRLIEDISDFFIPSPGRCYELGCSTGKLSNQLWNHHQNKDKVEFVAIDNSLEMIEHAKSKYASSIQWVHEDVNNFKFEKADLIIAYYTMQFIHPRQRQQLIQRIYDALNWGGAFIVFEKVRGPDARFQDLASTLYTEYKLQNGYKAEEIIQKTRSLKGILEPFSTQGNVDLLRRAGFSDINSVLKYICFEGLLAIK